MYWLLIYRKIYNFKSFINYMDIKYVIPSYKRVDILKSHTISFLERNNIPKNSIYIFVVPEEYISYKEAFPEYTIVEGKVGLKNQRNFITDYFDEGTYIVSLDDDIIDMIIKKQDDFISVNNFNDIVVDGFNNCLKEKCSLFGFYPVYNKGWLKDKITTDFRFIIGSCFGYINRKIYITVLQKQDYELSVLNYLRDKKVIRYTYITIKSNYYKTRGGLQSFNNRLEEQEEAVKYLVNKYPDYFALKKKKYKTNYPELRVKKVIG